MAGYSSDHIHYRVPDDDRHETIITDSGHSENNSKNAGSGDSAAPLVEMSEAEHRRRDRHDGPDRPAQPPQGGHGESTIEKLLAHGCGEGQRKVEQHLDARARQHALGKGLKPPVQFRREMADPAQIQPVKNSQKQRSGGGDQQELPVGGSGQAQLRGVQAADPAAPGSHGDEQPLKDNRGGIQAEPLGRVDLRLGKKLPYAQSASQGKHDSQEQEDEHEIPGH